MKELITIQTKLKAPKGQYNSFGDYYYRSLEDINEAVKPYLAELNCQLTLSDEMMAIGERYYIKATARLTNEKGEQVEVYGYAREAETKKKMDESQITGTASSYARKYALNGLFCLDDTKDADTDEYHKSTHKEEKKQDERAIVRAEIQGYADANGLTMAEIAKDYQLNAHSNADRLKEVLADLKGGEK